MPPVLITGVAGFIGNCLAQRFLQEGVPIVGIDNLNSYYDTNLKMARLKRFESDANFTFVKADLADAAALNDLFEKYKFEVVINLAAQAGVRHSLSNPHAYLHSNINGFLNVLEACRHNSVRHLLYASSSSVYGAVTKMPFSVHQNVDHPISLYAATKKSNELMAHCYSHLFRLPTTGLRFFTVYGPWGRPDMALFLFTRAMLAGEPIHIFNNGEMQRDFTYIDDIVEGIYRLSHQAPQPNDLWNSDMPDPGTSAGPYRIYNIGNNSTVPLMRVVGLLEDYLGVKAKKEFLEMQPGDVPATYADIEDLARDVGFRPQTSIERGIKHFVDWYREFYNV